MLGGLCNRGIEGWKVQPSQRSSELTARTVDDDIRQRLDLAEVALGERSLPRDDVELTDREVFSALEQREDVVVDLSARGAPVRVEVEQRDLARDGVGFEGRYVFTVRARPAPSVFGGLNRLAVRDDGAGLPVLDLCRRRRAHPSRGKCILPDFVGQRGHAAPEVYLRREVQVAGRV